jgi:hypothetical protein
MSSRRHSRILRFPSTPRGQSFFLLLAWFASLLLPAFHFEAEAELGSGHDCSGLFAKEASTPSLAASCPDGDDCTNPWHHHHSDAQHDASQCPICSSLLERIAETPVVFDVAPTRVALVAPRAARLPPLAERFVIALARGPPQPPSPFVEGAIGV